MNKNDLTPIAISVELASYFDDLLALAKRGSGDDKYDWGDLTYALEALVCIALPSGYNYEWETPGPFGMELEKVLLERFVGCSHKKCKCVKRARDGVERFVHSWSNWDDSGRPSKAFVLEGYGLDDPPKIPPFVVKPEAVAA